MVGQEVRQDATYKPDRQPEHQHHSRAKYEQREDKSAHVSVHVNVYHLQNKSDTTRVTYRRDTRDIEDNRIYS